jgi:hypothetical protein
MRATHWLIETKGQESVDVAHQDQAARLWCENATELTGTPWRYLKMPQSYLYTNFCGTLLASRRLRRKPAACRRGLDGVLFRELLYNAQDAGKRP